MALLAPVWLFNAALLPAALLPYFEPWKIAPAHAPTVAWNPIMWDGMAEFYPWRLFLSQSIRGGILPLWNPHELCGTPFLANGQSAVLYPLSVIFVWFPVASAFGISAIVHLFLTGTFMYALLRTGPMKLSRTSSLIGAITWQLSIWQIAWIHLPTFLTTSTWIPLALLIVYMIVTRRRALYSAALGLTLALMLLAGHLQIALYGLEIVAAATIFLPWIEHLDKRQKTLALKLCGLGVGLGITLALPQLLPSIELSHISHRAGTHATWTTFVAYSALAMPPFNLMTLFAPQFFGDPISGNYWGVTNYAENACYIGIPGLVLVIIAVTESWHERTVKFFATIGLIALFMALGSILNAIPFFLIPGYSQSGSPARILVIWSLCSSVLAGIGADRLLQLSPITAFARLTSAGKIGVLLCSIIVFAVMGWLVGTKGSTAIGEVFQTVPNFWRAPTAITIAVLVLIYGLKTGRITQSALKLLLTGLVAADLLTANFNVAQTARHSDVYPATALTLWLQRHSTDGRVMQINTTWSIPANHPPSAILPPNAGTVYGWREVQGYDSLLTGKYFRFVQRMNAPRAAAPQENGNMVFSNGFPTREANDADAKYVVSTTPLPASQGVKGVFTDGHNYVYENDSAKAEFEIDGAPYQGSTYISSDSIQMKGPLSPGPHVLTVADEAYPGWRTFVNGVPAQQLQLKWPFRANLLQIKNADGPVSSIMMTYRPSAFSFGLFAMLTALGTTAAIASYSAVANAYTRKLR